MSYPQSMDRLMQMLRNARRNLSRSEDFYGGLSLAMSVTEDQESMDLIDGLLEGELTQRIVDCGGVPVDDAVIGPMAYMLAEGSDGLWAAACQSVLTCAFTASQGPTRALCYVVSEAELALRRARLERALPAADLPAMPPCRALCRQKLRRARFLVDVGLDSREPDDRHAAICRLAEAARLGL